MLLTHTRSTLALDRPPAPALEAAQPVYMCGKDKQGRPALIIVGRTVHAHCQTQQVCALGARLEAATICLEGGHL